MSRPVAGPWHTVRDEVSAVLSAVSSDQMAAAARLFGDRGRRWFCTGQGRSGLVAEMVAMRLMHAGFDAHAVGEASAPSIAADDGIVIFSGSGETPVTIHLARLAAEFGGTLFEQSALLLLDAVVVEIISADPHAHAAMQARHANLQ